MKTAKQFRFNSQQKFYQAKARKQFLNYSKTISRLHENGDYTCYSINQRVSVTGQVTYNSETGVFRAGILANIEDTVKSSSKNFHSISEAVEWVQLVSYTTLVYC